MSAAFRCRVGDYLLTDDFEKLGRLIAASAEGGFATHFQDQTEAWRAELKFLKTFCEQLTVRLPTSRDWYLLFEFEIPRRGNRPDVVLLAADLIFILEFKIGADVFLGGYLWQALSYGLDLRDFHIGSQERIIVPVLIATGFSSPLPIAPGTGQTDASEEASALNPAVCPPALTRDGRVLPVQRSGDPVGVSTGDIVCDLYSRWHQPNATIIDAAEWEKAPYRPTPTIIEAAEEIFKGHSVTNISHAFATNLDVTCGALLQAIENACAEKRRVICFVTGIPGAGKTLAGLNAVHDPAVREQGRPAAVFLSGNGPLVKIVRAALVRDRRRTGVSAKDATRTVRTFIDNVHRFIKTYGIQRPEEAPYENAIIFDEAQRAWNADAVFRLHKIKKSEPELVLDIMERAPGWSVIIALVGGGQEINRGEAGLEEWGRALAARASTWKVLASPAAVMGGHAVSSHRLFASGVPQSLELVARPELHLEVSVRSPRARRISEWVDALLTGVDSKMLEVMGSDEFPIVLTRDLDTARDWLRVRSEGVQRCGLLASSGALRLRPHGIEVSTGFRHGFPYEQWFLADARDPRSSMSLEVAATEFECQGLELDWTCICWGGDMVISSKQAAWVFRRFLGKSWRRVRGASQVQYMRNKYRVLLTRARRGMVIWVPEGDPSDSTREPDLLDLTAGYLAERGVPMLT
jgi:hypothetical protein